MDGSVSEPALEPENNLLKATQSDSLNLAEGTIIPGMLKYDAGYDLTEQLDSTIFTGGYESRVGFA